MMSNRPPVTNPIAFETERLLLRQWTPTDREPFAALCADPRVMEFFPRRLSRAESDAFADRCESLIQARGWGFWAAELKASREFIGFVGLHIPSAELPCSPCVEIGWRIAFPYWGRALASEAAREAVRVGFTSLGLTEIVSFTAVGNTRSRAVMERLDMQASGTFDHPLIAEGHPLRRHCLYRLPRSRAAAGQTIHSNARDEGRAVVDVHGQYRVDARVVGVHNDPDSYSWRPLVNGNQAPHSR